MTSFPDKVLAQIAGDAPLCPVDPLGDGRYSITVAPRVSDHVDLTVTRNADGLRSGYVLSSVALRVCDADGMRNEIAYHTAKAVQRIESAR